VTHEAYGSSEFGYMTPWTAARRSSNRARPAGHCSTELRILDDAGRVLPAGMAGLIYVRQTGARRLHVHDNDIARRAMEREVPDDGRRRLSRRPNGYSSSSTARPIS